MNSDHLTNTLYKHAGETKTQESTYFEGPMKHHELHSTSSKKKLEKHIPAAKDSESHVYSVDGHPGLVVHHKGGISAIGHDNHVHHFEDSHEGIKKLSHHISKHWNMPHDDEVEKAKKEVEVKKEELTPVMNRYVNYISEQRK